MRRALTAPRRTIAALAAALLAGSVGGCASRALTVTFQKSEYSYGNAVVLRDAKALAVENPAIFQPEVDVQGQRVTYTLKDPGKRREAIAKLAAHPLLGPSLSGIAGEKSLPPKPSGG